MSTVLLLAVSLLWSAQSPVAPAQLDPNLIRIYIRTDDGGNAQELAARRDSVRHLQSAISGKKKVLVIVPDQDRADVVIDVLDRGLTVPKIVFGIGARSGQRPDPGAPPQRNVQLRVRVDAVEIDDDAEIKNKNRALDSDPGWKSAADDVARQIEKWADDRRAKILAARF